MQKQNAQSKYKPCESQEAKRKHLAKAMCVWLLPEDYSTAQDSRGLVKGPPLE